MIDKEFVSFRLDFETKAIRAQMSKYFDNQHEEIHKLIESEITPEKIVLKLKDVLDKELPRMISSAVELNIRNSISFNKDLNEYISKETSKIVKKLKK